MKKDKKPKASKKQTPTPPTHIEKIEARHNFSDEEKLAMLSELTRLNQDHERLVDEMKASSKGWKSRIESVLLRVKAITDNASNGYEFRLTECKVVFDAKKGKKRYYRKDNEEFVEERDMNPSDYELPLFATDVKPAKPGEGLTSVAAAIEKADEAKAMTVEEAYTEATDKP